MCDTNSLMLEKHCFMFYIIFVIYLEKLLAKVSHLKLTKQNTKQ